MQTRRLAFALSAALLLACGGGGGDEDAGGPGVDAGLDASSADSGVARDASTRDASTSDAGTSDAGASDAGATDAGTNADASVDAGGDCGDFGKPCSGAGDCGGEYMCDTFRGRCLPSTRPICGGFAGAACPGSGAYTECLYLMSADYGPCLTPAEAACACVMLRGTFVCS